MRKRDKDARVAALAKKQLGVLRRDQLLGLGLTQSDLHRRVKAGTLLRVLPRVYRVAAVPETWEGLLMSALLWAGPGAVVSHAAAARIYSLTGVECERAEITLPRVLRYSSPWVAVHLSTDLHPRHIRREGQFPVTNPTRTVIDLAGVLNRDQFELVAEEAAARRLTSIDQIERMLQEVHHRGRAGVELVGEFVDRRAGGVAESPLEIRLLKLIRGAGVGDPVRQLTITLPTGKVVRPDIAFPDEKIAIEFDSYRFHSGLRAWSRDRARRNELTSMGWTVLQATYEDLKSPAALLRQITQVLQARRTG